MTMAKHDVTTFSELPPPSFLQVWRIKGGGGSIRIEPS